MRRDLFSATRAILLCVVVAPAVGAPGPALAQRVIDPTDPRLRAPAARPSREQLRPPLPGTIGPSDAREGVIAVPGEPPEVVAPGDGDAVVFLLRGLQVEGATVYGPEELEQVYGPFIGTEITLGGLREIANRIEQKYREDDYLATRVIVPPQAIEAGMATLEVFEGTIIHYEINGEIGPAKKQIARLLDNLVTGEPARWPELERYLLLARDLPGISLTGTLRSAGDTAPGGVILVVDAARKPFEGFLNLQNRNSEPTGTFTISGGLSANSNTRFAERVGGVVLIAPEVPEQVSGYLSYEQSLGNDGLRIQLSGVQGFSEPGDQLEELKLSTLSTIVDLELEYPVVRSREISLWTRGGIEYAQQRTDFGKPEVELFDDQYTVLYAGARVLALPPLGGLSELNVEVRQGLNEFGASVNSRADASTDFLVARAVASHRQPVPPFFEIFALVEAQKASEPLPSLEELSFGELTVGRGYEPGSLVGDNGVGATVELRYFPPGIDLEWLDDFHVFGFFDYALVDDFGNPTGNPDDFEDLYSAGFGARFQVFETLFGNVYYAQPLTRALDSSPRRPNPTVRFSLTKFF